MSNGTTRLPVVDGVAFRLIPGQPGYAAGDDGSIWSCWRPGAERKRVMCDTWKRLKPWRTHCGTLLVNIKGRTVQAHRLTLLAFVGPCPPGMEACHYPDRDRSNNAVTNLRWDTKKANADDKVKHGTMAIGVRSGRAKLNQDAVREIRREAARGVKNAELARRFRVTWRVIQLVLNGETWGHVT